MRTTGEITRFALLFAVALILLNVVGTRLHLRLDLTSDHRYTLSKASLDLLKELPEAVTVTGYFTKELPPDLAAARDEFKDLLVEYASRSEGNVVFEMIDPADADSLEQHALENGIRPLLVNTREKDKAEQIRAFMGAVIRMGTQKAVIPVVQPTSPMEWELSSRIKQVSVVEKPTVGIVQGHGEPSTNALGELLLGLASLYNIEPTAIYDTFPIHGRFSTLVFVDPKDTISDLQLQRLEEFMGKGHGVVIALSATESDLQRSPMVAPRPSSFTPWLMRHGVLVDDALVADAQCGQVQVMQQRGYFNMQTAIAFPYFPLVTSFAEHPVTSGLEAVVMQFATALGTTADSTYRITPLLTTSAKSALLSTPLQIDIQKQWTDADFPAGPQTLAMAVEGPFGHGGGARMVVMSNGNFAVGEGQGAQLNPDNVNLLVNAVDWVSDQTGLIELRGKGVDYRPLDELSDAQRGSLKWMNLLLPLALVVLYGLLRLQWRRRQRRARTVPGYVA